MFLNNASRILVLAAHPDDETLGCGGTIARGVDCGAAVRVVFLGEGVSARFSTEKFNSAEMRMATRVREEGARNALSVLGVAPEQAFFGTRHCCRFDQVPLIEITQEIEQHLRQFDPTHILVHNDADVNIDHCLTHRALLGAIRPVAATSLAAVLAYEVPSSTDWNTGHPFRANVFVDISATVERKLGALACYAGEMPGAPHSRSPEKIRALAEYRGAQCGLHQAEAFGLVRLVVPAKPK